MGEFFVNFQVMGTPRPKQSFVFSSKDNKVRGYKKQLVIDWQNMVAMAAREAMMRKTPHHGPVAVELLFSLPDARKRDLDNLSKGTLDAMRGICYDDDNQVVRLLLEKRIVNPKDACAQIIVRKHE